MHTYYCPQQSGGNEFVSNIFNLFIVLGFEYKYGYCVTNNAMSLKCFSELHILQKIL